MNQYSFRTYSKIPNGWFDENKFIKNITPAQRWILTGLTSNIHRRKEPRHTDSLMIKKICGLTKYNRLLISYISYDKMIDKFKVDRKTLDKAIKVFKDYGAVVQIYNGKKNNYSAMYIIGMTQTMDNKSNEFLLSDSNFLRDGDKTPTNIIEHIQKHYDDFNGLHKISIEPYNQMVGTILFNQRWWNSVQKVVEFFPKGSGLMGGSKGTYQEVKKRVGLHI